MHGTLLHGSSGTTAVAPSLGQIHSVTIDNLRWGNVRGVCGQTGDDVKSFRIDIRISRVGCGPVK